SAATPSVARRARPGTIRAPRAAAAGGSSSLRGGVSQDPARHLLERRRRHGFLELRVLAEGAGGTGLEEMIEVGQFLDRDVAVAPGSQRLLDRIQVFPRHDL